jgi:hypothetical protein
VKKFHQMLATGILIPLLFGCATAGPHYDDGKVALIQKDVTTESDLVRWFGPANARALSGDGSETLRWTFGPAMGANHGTGGNLNVNLNPDGKVLSYAASESHK